MRLYRKYFSMHLRGQMEYKASFVMTLFGQFFVAFSVVAAMYIIFERFHLVDGFSFEDALICFAVVGMGHAFCEAFVRGFDHFPQMISNGEFDRILVRPRGIIFQVLATKMDFTRLGKLIQSAVVLAYAVPNSGIDWTPDKILTLIFMILSSGVIFSGVFILYGAVSFFTIEGIEFMNILVYGARQFGQYPYSIYGRGILIFLTAIVPLALCQYWPFLYLSGREASPALIFLPLLGCLFVIPCYAVWRIGVRHYKSTGS